MQLSQRDLTRINYVDMKKFIILVAFIISFTGTSAQKLQALLSYCSFYLPDEGPYFETYLSIDGKGITYIKNANNKYVATVEVTTIFKLDTIRKFAKYDLVSPEKKDTFNLDFHFIDQQRYPLSQGVYNLELNIKDKNRNETPYRVTVGIPVDYPKNKVNVSGIELLESYKKAAETNILTKSGYDLIPSMTNFFPETVSKLIFYAEVYNTQAILGENQKFLLSYYIESFEPGKPLNEYIINSRETSSPVIPLLKEFDISNLPSGNYNLVISIRDQQNNEISSNKLFFQRRNPSVVYDMTALSSVKVDETFVSRIKQADSLKYYLRSINPISTQTELQYAQNLLKTPEILPMQQYFYNFWVSHNDLNPEKEWRAYLTMVKMVEKSFGTKIKRGFDTDRGRVYLKYGPPNTITDVPYETSTMNGEGTVPYQIWHYYGLPRQGSRKFVFYNPELSTNNYELIHSDAVGEITNYNWQSLIRYRKKGEKLGDPPFGNEPEKYDGKSGEYYRMPR